MASPKLRVSFAWWLRPYLAGVVMMARLTRCEPDMLKVGRWIARGTKTKVIR